MRILIFHTFLFCCASIFAQENKPLKKDTVIGGFKGVETTHRGKYNFKTELHKEVVDNQLHLAEIHINGQLTDAIKEGEWKYQFMRYQVNDMAITRSNTLRVNPTLKGKEDAFLIRYKFGQRVGKAEWLQKTISQNPTEQIDQLASIRYHNDTLIRNFQFKLNDVQINGQTNLQGYFDGIIELNYRYNSDSVLERRRYDDGFLLELTKLSLPDEDTLVHLNYAEVATALSNVRTEENASPYIVSDNYFGVEFRFGYQQNDPKITEQVVGNTLLQKNLRFFDAINDLLDQQAIQPTILKLTRRFQFTYDTTDQLSSRQLSLNVDSLRRKIDIYLNKPNLLLRKNNSANLNELYETLSFLHQQLDPADEVVKKMESGYFNFISRKKYYENGIPGLNLQDSLPIKFNNTNYRIGSGIPRIKISSDSLFHTLNLYVNQLHQRSDSVLHKINTALTIYDNQERIDSLDQIIRLKEEVLASLYADAERYKDQEPAKQPFSYKMYYSLHERAVDQIKTRYLGKAPQQDMISLGTALICHYTLLLEHKFYFDSIGNMKKYWSDSLFTEYRDNPFDFRKIQTQILEGVQHAGNTLLTHYANQLLYAKTCEQVSTEIQKIRKLEERINYLVEHKDILNVQKLNKALRRERVPNRIERMLEL